jgi:hypothetical protein
MYQAGLGVFFLFLTASSFEQTGTRFFTQELYEGFEYLQATPYFHTFESDNSICTHLNFLPPYFSWSMVVLTRMAIHVLHRQWASHLPSSRTQPASTRL